MNWERGLHGGKKENAQIIPMGKLVMKCPLKKIYLPVCLVYLFINLSTNLSIYLSIYLSILPVYLSIWSIYLPIYPSCPYIYPILSQKVKRVERETDHAHPSSAEGTNGGATPPPPIRAQLLRTGIPLTCFT
jgi:hypothetical protein